MKELILFLVFTTMALPQTEVEDIQAFTLSNGMKLIVLEDNSIPNANMYLFYKVGSRNEYPGITGISHFFEHMMFNGAKKYGPKEFDIVMADPPYYDGHDYGVKPYSFISEAGRCLKVGGYLIILHTLRYIVPKGMEAFALIGVSTGPNLKARFINIFKKVEHTDIKKINSEQSMRRMA